MNFSKSQLFLIALILGIIGGNLITNWANRAEKIAIKKNRDEIIHLLYDTQLMRLNDSVKYTNEIDRLVVYIDELYNKPK